MKNIIAWLFSFGAVYSVNELDNIPAGLVCFLFAVAFFRAARGRRVPIIGRITDALTREKPPAVSVDIIQEDGEKPGRVLTAAEKLETAKQAAAAENKLVKLYNKRERLEYVNGGNDLQLRRLYASKQWRALEYDIQTTERELQEYQ